jgi:hypothetical protein
LLGQLALVADPTTIDRSLLHSLLEFIFIRAP